MILLFDEIKKDNGELRAFYTTCQWLTSSEYRFWLLTAVNLALAIAVLQFNGRVVGIVCTLSPAIQKLFTHRDGC